MKHITSIPRRVFLKSLGLAVPVAAASPDVAFSQTQNSSTAPGSLKQAAAKELAADLVVIGGSVGGCA
ncbi:MAG TPA: hypothetical protein VIL39_07225, partial [Verrucomicrobiae bacterium]